MPKGGRKGNKKNASPDCTTDVKLSDFANSSVSAVRLKKPATNFAREVKNICGSENAWFERDIEEFETFENDAQKVEKEKALSKFQALKTEGFIQSAIHGHQYPIDLWFLIADYIHPEDVQKFASLCKSAHHVTKTYKFWIGMYKRFYNPEAQLPVCLQPQCIEKPICLRVSVVRSLHHLYPYFMDKMSHNSARSREIYKLTNTVCANMWRSQSSGKWHFYFKFCSLPVRTYCYAKKKNQELYWWESRDAIYQDDPLALMNDVNLNPDDGCKILHVVSTHFVASPPVIMGSYLAGVKISLARDMVHQKLQLIFSYSNYKRLHNSQFSLKDIDSNGELIEFDPVDSMVLMNWWHPQYPISNC